MSTMFLCSERYSRVVLINSCGDSVYFYFAVVVLRRRRRLFSGYHLATVAARGAVPHVGISLALKASPPNRLMAWFSSGEKSINL